MPATRLPIIGGTDAASPLEGVVRAGLEAVGSPIQLERWARRPHQLAEALGEIRSGDDFAGTLIGAPHKERAPGLSDALSDDARSSGAVNIHVRLDGRLRGHNTDADGIRIGIESLLPKVRGTWPRNAVVLGAGGGARAVIGVLIGYGFQHVAVFNRHLHKAEALVAHFARAARQMELRARPWHDAIIEAELARAELLVNATGIGADEGASPISDELIPEGRYVLDLVLNQAETPLMRAASARGGTVANGQAAFLEGCAQSVRLVSGTTPAPVSLRAALADELGGVAVVGD